MSNTSIKMLANTRTRSETGFEHILSEIETCTSYGNQKKKQFAPFFPGMEDALSKAYDDIDVLCDIARTHKEKINDFLSCLWQIKEMNLTLSRARNQTLTVVELFDVKIFLLRTKQIAQMLCEATADVPQTYSLKDTTDLLDRLDPSKERIDTFYIYDSFSETLAELRKENRRLEVELRKINKERKAVLEAEHGFRMTPKFELLVPKADKELVKLALALPDLKKVDEDYMSLVFTIAPTDEIYEITKEKEVLEAEIEKEELLVCDALTKEIARFEEDLRYNCEVIGQLDFDFGKARYAVAHDCVRPSLTRDHRIQIVNGRNLVVEEILSKKGKPYCPVTVDLSEGVFAITGANMGGKTISLKMMGQIALLVQYGLYVPCESALVGLSNFIQILVGDGQNIQRGLSSFGSEMEELREILDHAKERSLIMIDEIASGTNPTEGLAITKSFIDYFSSKPYITVVTTHFDYATVGSNIVNLQVRGLSGADFNKLYREISHANRKERIEIISKYTDYRLEKVDKMETVPKDALNIAKMLGVYEEIIEGAKKYLTQ